MPDLVAGLSVAGLALVTILTVCLATVLLVRRWATGDCDFELLKIAYLLSFWSRFTLYMRPKFQIILQVSFMGLQR